MMNPGRPPQVPLVVVGCDFHNAAVAFRSALVSTPQERREMYEGINRIEPDCGFVAVETCNRVEWLVSTGNPEWIAQLLTAQMLNRWQQALPEAESYPTPYVHTGREAALHQLRVVAGLESLAAGEAQIAGQFQDAMTRARDEGMSSGILNGLANAAGRVAKVGLRVGFRADNHRGVHGLSSEFLRQHFNGNTADKVIAVAGMGSIGRKAADTFELLLGCRTLRLNRTVADQHTESWLPLGQLPEVSATADALVVATGGLKPVIQAEHLSTSARGNPLVVLDIGIPAQVSEEARALPQVDYHNLDSLIGLKQSAANLKFIDEMNAEITRELALFKRYCVERSIVSLLEDTQRRRREYNLELIPELIERELAGLDEGARRQVAELMMQMITDYAADSFKAIHKALDEYWSSS